MAALFVMNSLVFRRPVPKGTGANSVSSRKFLLLCFFSIRFSFKINSVKTKSFRLV